MRGYWTVIRAHYWIREVSAFCTSAQVVIRQNERLWDAAAATQAATARIKGRNLISALDTRWRPRPSGPLFSVVGLDGTRGTTLRECYRAQAECVCTR